MKSPLPQRLSKRCAGVRSTTVAPLLWSAWLPVQHAWHALSSAVHLPSLNTVGSVDGLSGPSADRSGAGVCLWLPRVSLVVIMIIGVYVLLTDTEEGRFARQLSAPSAHLPSQQSHSLLCARRLPFFTSMGENLRPGA